VLAKSSQSYFGSREGCIPTEATILPVEPINIVPESHCSDFWQGRSHIYLGIYNRVSPGEVTRRLDRIKAWPGLYDNLTLPHSDKL